MTPRPAARLGLAALLPVLAVSPAVAVPTTTPGAMTPAAMTPAATTAAATTAERGGRYAAPVPGQVARPFDPPAEEWEPGHRGVDLWSARGAEIRSPGAGVVSFAGSVAGKPVVVVTHPDGLRSSLEPVTAAVPEGTSVAAGDAVGQLAAAPGNEANPDHCAALAPAGPGAACLHWGVRRGEIYLDPLTLLGTAEPIVLLPPR